MSSKTSSSVFSVGDRDEFSDATLSKARTSKARTFIMVGFCASGWVMSFDAVVVGNALPSIAKDLQASSVAYAWVISAYLLASASFLPLWAKLSDILGRKPVIMTSHIVFLLGTLISALSRNSSMLIAGRALQGVGCGGVEVLMGICIADMTTPRERSFFIAISGAAQIMGATTAPILAGVLVQSTSWRWCFWITLAVDIISLILLVLFLDQANSKMSVLQGLCSLDWPGVVTVSSGAVLLLSGLQVGSTEHSWATVKPIAPLVAGIILLTTFIFLQWKYPTRAVIPLRIFGASSNIAVLLICVAHGFSYIAALFFLPIYFQVVLQWKPIDAGIVLLALAIPLAASIVASGIYIEKTGRYRRIICGSAFFLTLGYGLCIDLPGHLSWPRVILFQAILALGIGPLFQIPLIALQSRIDPDDITAANSAYASARELSSSISAVIGAVILQSQLQNQQRFLIAQGLPQQLVSGLHRDFALFTKGSSFELALSTQQRHLVRQAISTALRNMWIMYCATSSVAFLTSFVIQHAELSQTRAGLPNKS